MESVKRVDSIEAKSSHDVASKQTVERLAYRQLTEICPYGGSFKHIRCEYSDGTLTLRGKLPTFYLKQMLQTCVRGLEGVEQIDNQVDVISSTGLSSVRPK